MSCFDSTTTKSDIDNKCCITVEGYIKQHLGEITAVMIMPMCVSDIILFFYAKPMYIRILNKSQMITVLYCEAIDCWSSLYKKIKYKFNYNLLPYNFSLSYNGKTITKEEWNNFNFKEYDIFIINPFILPQQWDLIITTMASTMTPQQQYRTFCKLKKITNNLITRNNPRYRTLHLNNRLTDDFLEFLYHLGFVKPGTAQDIRICHDVNETTIQACLTSLQHKIEILSCRVVPKNKNLNMNPIPPLQSQPQNDKQTKTNHFYIVQAYIRLQTAYYNIFIPTDIIDLIHFMFDDHILKTFIFIRHGSAVWGRCKNANSHKRYPAKIQVINPWDYLHGRRNPTNDHTWVIDAPLSKTGITDSIALKTFLAKHLKLRKLKSLFKTQIAKPIHNVLQIINENILSKYEKELMQSCNVDLFNKYQQINNIMQSVYDQIQHSILHIGITNKNGIVNEHNDLPDLYDYNYLEQLLDLEWVLDRMISDCSSIIASSPLKRAINTTLITLWDRFSATKEHLHILPCLQEIGMGIDIYSQSIPVFEINDFEKVSKKINVNELKTFYENRLLIDEYKFRGYENVPNTTNRLHYFCDWAFKQNNENGLPYNIIIACGHSHWIQAFFKTFLPKNTESIATKRKLYNCGVVGFKMISYTGHKNQRIYEIVEQSITTIYKGFC